ncbi:MAG TPA: hypothetical protein VFX43_15095 [Chitinophagaceae bacterium]|nr:hypothetical protein [Chitinophagaceae bacterium]
MSGHGDKDGGGVEKAIAASYPHDIGIEKDPDVLYVEKFDDGMSNILSRYSDILNSEGMSVESDVPPGSKKGSSSLKITSIGGVNSGGHLFRRFDPGFDSVVYIRYYVKYPLVSKGYTHHEAIWFGGYNPSLTYPFPKAGICGLGDSRLSVSYEPVSQTDMNTYLYWGGMKSWNGGSSCYGNTMIHESPVAHEVPWDKWTCVEVMIKLNNPVSASNGELRIWQDGVEVGYWGPGFPKGHWEKDTWHYNEADPPFEGFRWRTDENLDINYIWIEYYHDQSPESARHYILFDNLVVADRYIGPIKK